MRNSASHERVLLVVVLAATVWVSRFWYSSEFGFYEDDYWRVSISMQQTAAEVGQELSSLISRFERRQGRPLHDGLIRLFSYLGAQLGGLQGVYFLGYCCVALNALLFYALLRRISRNQAFVWIGALAFALYPADTTQAFLTHAFGIQPSLTFLLVAAHLYLSGSRIPSYIVATVSLFCYETVYLVFLAVPLLERRWDGEFRRRLLVHTGITVAVLCAVVVLRGVAGEGRVARLELMETALAGLKHMILGPAVSLTSYFWRPVEALRMMGGAMPWFFGISAVVFLLWLCNAEEPDAYEAPPRRTKGPRKEYLKRERGLLPKEKREDRSVLLEMAWWALTGLIMLLLAYPFTLTGLGTETHGRGTRVHVAAALGAALVIAALLAVLFHYAARYRVTLAVVVAVSVLFGALVLSGVRVQQGYVACWRMQQRLWQAIVREAPDMDEGDAIFVEVAELAVTEEMPVWSWPTFMILPQIYKMPGTWEVNPQVFRLPWNWRQQLLSGRDLREFAIRESERDRYKNAEIILLEGKAANLKRSANPLILEGQRFPLKDIPSEMGAPFRKGMLYQYLIGE